jgi:hypothetical protein
MAEISQDKIIEYEIEHSIDNAPSAVLVLEDQDFSYSDINDINSRIQIKDNVSSYVYFDGVVRKFKNKATRGNTGRQVELICGSVFGTFERVPIITETIGTSLSPESIEDVIDRLLVDYAGFTPADVRVFLWGGATISGCYNINIKEDSLLKAIKLLAEASGAIASGPLPRWATAFVREDGKLVVGRFGYSAATSLDDTTVISVSEALDESETASLIRVRGRWLSDTREDPLETLAAKEITSYLTYPRNYLDQTLMLEKTFKPSDLWGATVSTTLDGGGVESRIRWVRGKHINVITYYTSPASQFSPGLYANTITIQARSRSVRNATSIDNNVSRQLVRVDQAGREVGQQIFRMAVNFRGFGQSGFRTGIERSDARIESLRTKAVTSRIQGRTTFVYENPYISSEAIADTIAEAIDYDLLQKNRFEVESTDTQIQLGQSVTASFTGVMPGISAGIVIGKKLKVNARTGKMQCVYTIIGTPAS